LKDYYQILRVRRGASAAEIRRAYRVLVQQLHPDINPDPAAHELIKEVNEAYDVLSDPVKKQEYEYRLDNPYTTVFVQEKPKHRDPAYKRKTYYHKPTGRPTQREIMERYIHFAPKVFWIGVTLSAILFLDLMLPPRVIHDSVTVDISGLYDGGYLHTTGGEHIKISNNKRYVPEQEIEIVNSQMFSILIEIHIPTQGVVDDNLSSIFANFRFVLWILAIFSIVGLTVKGWVEFRFNLGVMTFFVLMFAIILLIK
jgi:hypothetical protein